MSPIEPTRLPPGPAKPRRLPVVAVVGLCVAVLVSACSTSSNPGGAADTTALVAATAGTGCGGTGKVEVVAAENFWGSIASQLGGTHASVTSIITSPDTDPHDYEPTPDDGRTIATAKYVIGNGLGYDPWVTELAEANPSASRKVLDIGGSLGLDEGVNPHRWYFPGDVDQVIDRITADYKQIAPADAACFDQLNGEYKTKGLEQYKGLIAQIKQKYGGTSVGASESIFVGIAEATGLELVTPASYLDAISEGNDPTAQDKATVDAQINGKQIKVFVFNSQNSTPDVQSLVDQARAEGIPISTLTETLEPADATFQDWQSHQLRALLDALDGRSSG
jgi:zinc/manganese transport system substrate-binding protein